MWLEEGAAQLAERLNGYADEVATVYSFANSPETQLNTWSESSAGENSAHYGGGYLFWSYLYDRFGEDVVKAAGPLAGAQRPGVHESAGGRRGSPTRIPAGLIRSRTCSPTSSSRITWAARASRATAPTGINYTDTDVPPISVAAECRQRVEQLDDADDPHERQEQVNQFGTNYIELRGDAPVQVDFTGSTVVPLLPMAGADGAFWWSNRADASNPRLTREFDLTGVQTATLAFRAWYRIERDYDYAYVSVSADGGQTWAIQATQTCTADNPNGANLGCGFTGTSGAGSVPQWIQESVDLSAYAGQRILLRFELVTDAGVNREGLGIDNIEIPEIGYADAVDGDEGWIAEGFVRITPDASGTPQLPQAWRVQALLFGKDGTVTLKRVPLAADNSGSLLVDLGRDGVNQRAVLAISAVTPVTTEPGTYRLAVRSTE